MLSAPHARILGQSTAQSEALPVGTAGQRVFGSNANYYRSVLAEWDEDAALETLRASAGLLYPYVGSEMDLPLAAWLPPLMAFLDGKSW